MIAASFVQIMLAVTVFVAMVIIEACCFGLVAGGLHERKWEVAIFGVIAGTITLAVFLWLGSGPLNG